MRIRSLNVVDDYCCPGCRSMLRCPLKDYIQHTNNCKKYQDKEKANSLD